MKENSIEEDIKLLEEMIENANIENMDMNDCFGGEHIEAIEHILSDYKRVLKENEELKNEVMEKDLEIIGKEEYTKASMKEIIEQYYTANEECISKQIIKDKIEEIKQEKKKYGNCLIEMYEDELVNRDIKILQELLESEE